MGRHAEHSHTLADGTRVGYGLVKRAGLFRARFVTPDGKRVERATGQRTKNDAHRVAAAAIRQAYRPEQPDATREGTWEQALRDLEATPHLRPDTLRDYRKAIAVLRKLVPALRRPADVTAATAARFVRLLGSTKFKRSKASDGTTYVRSANTVRGYVRKLRSLWAKHLREFGYVSDNPWAAVTPPPAVRHAPRVPGEEDVAAFFAWVAGRYPGWDLLRCVLEVKALSGCRTLDVCQLRSSQLTAAGIAFAAGQTKTRTARTVPLPDDLCRALRRVAGPTYLWERYTEEARTHRPGTRNKTTFDPRTLYWAVTNLFREYSAEHPDAPVKAHDLRRRAITLTATVTQSVDAAAQAMGVDPQTARKHYLDAQRAFDGEELLKRMAGILRPKG